MSLIVQNINHVTEYYEVTTDNTKREKNNVIN